jgi:hypothetical protein
MAASPMALLPFIRTLATVDLNRYFRADQSAHGAASAFAVTVKKCRRITGSVKLGGYRNDLFRAEGNAELTAFAQLLVYFNISIHSVTAFLKNSRLSPEFIFYILNYIVVKLQQY